MINSISNSNLAQMPFMRNVTKTLQNPSGREAEILDGIREKISSRFGVPVKINHGTQGESGKTVAFTGFMGGFSDGVHHAEMFLLTPHMLAEMAESEYKYEKWMAWINENIERQQALGTVFPSAQSPTVEADFSEAKSNLVKNAIQKHNSHMQTSIPVLSEEEYFQAANIKHGRVTVNDV